MVKLGSKVKDEITGFSGTAIGRTEWLMGCARIGIKPNKLNKNGTTIEAEWFDEPQVVIIAAIKEKKKVKGHKPGGPQSDPLKY